MPKYSYRAYTISKEKKEGIVEAESKTDVLRKLEGFSLFPLDIVLIDENKKNIAKKMRIKSKDIIIFTSQLSNLLDAGLTILSALTLIVRQKRNSYFKLVIDNIIKDLKEGATFSEALFRHPHDFSKLYIFLVKAGEAGGFLEEIMSRLAELLENEEELKTKIKSAMFYPFLITIVGLITVFILLTFVIPKLALVFEDFGQSLPLPTQILVNISNLLSRYWWLVVLAITLIFFVIKRTLRNAIYRSFFDNLKLKTPILGIIILKREIERFCRTLGMLLLNGITIMSSLEVVGDTIENNVLKKEIENIRIKVRDGLSFAEAMVKSKYFSVSVVNMISVGEETGNLENVLKKIAHNYDKEIDRDIKIFISLLEPFMILAMGLVVAFIVVAMLLPIFQINFITL